MAKNYEITLLFDYYGDMLTPKQRDFLHYYYDVDLSLAEIAANAGITRQGVRDAIKRAECQLLDMEQRLGHVARLREIRKGLDEIVDCAAEISAENRRTALSKVINGLSAKIRSVANSLME